MVVKKKRDQYEIFTEFLGEYPHLDRKYTSPLRPDNKPGCTITLSGGLLWFHDWATGQHFNAYQIERGLIPQGSYKVKSKKSSRSVSKVVAYRSRKEKEDVRKFYELGGINIDHFERNGYRIERVNRTVFRSYGVEEYKLEKDLCIAYVYPSGNTKIYRPYSQPKWSSNTNKLDIWNYMPGQDEYIIASSAKDAMVLETATGINSIALNSELPDIPEQLVPVLSSKRVYVLYDNDDTGRANSKQLCNKYGFTNIHLNNHKDPYEQVFKESLSSLQSTLVRQGLSKAST